MEVFFYSAKISWDSPSRTIRRIIPNTVDSQRDRLEKKRSIFYEKKIDHFKDLACARIQATTHGIMVGVRHGVGNLCPSHAVLDGHLVRRAANHGRLHRTAAGRHVPENGRPDFLLFVPPTAPSAQAHERQHDNGNGRHRRADRHAQHFSVDLALSPVKRSRTPAEGGRKKKQTKYDSAYQNLTFFFFSSSSEVGGSVTSHCTRIYIQEGWTN